MKFCSLCGSSKTCCYLFIGNIRKQKAVRKKPLISNLPFWSTFKINSFRSMPKSFPKRFFCETESKSPSHNKNAFLNKARPVSSLKEGIHQVGPALESSHLNLFQPQEKHCQYSFSPATESNLDDRPRFAILRPNPAAWTNRDRTLVLLLFEEADAAEHALVAQDPEAEDVVADLMGGCGHSVADLAAATPVRFTTRDDGGGGGESIGRKGKPISPTSTPTTTITRSPGRTRNHERRRRPIRHRERFGHGPAARRDLVCGTDRREHGGPAHRGPALQGPRPGRFRPVAPWSAIPETPAPCPPFPGFLARRPPLRRRNSSGWKTSPKPGRKRPKWSAGSPAGWKPNSGRGPVRRPPFRSRKRAGDPLGFPVDSPRPVATPARRPGPRLRGIRREFQSAFLTPKSGFLGRAETR